MRPSIGRETLPVRPMLLYLMFAVIVSAEAAQATDGPIDGEVFEPDATFLEDRGMSAFYRKAAVTGGLVVCGSEKVTEFAVLEATYLVDQMLQARPDVKRAMAEAGIRVVVMAASEMTTDVPEHSHLEPAFWDKRARGLGASRRSPVVSCGEENLLCFPGDPYRNENILIHEFGHGVHSVGMRGVDETFQERLTAAYNDAMSNGRWQGTYAAENAGEYWAEGTQVWFECNAPPGGIHNDIQSRQQIREYDPSLAALLEEAYGDTQWRYERPEQRQGQEHLKGFELDETQRFAWPEKVLSASREQAQQRRAGRRGRRGGAEEQSEEAKPQTLDQ